MPVEYNGTSEEAAKAMEKAFAAPKIIVNDGLNENPIKAPIVFRTVRPDDGKGGVRDQRPDAARHMRYAHTLNLPELYQRPIPRYGRAIIVGGAPSINDQLENIRGLAKDPNNGIFAINWSHTWLLQRNIIPKYCVFFEVDSEPETVLKNAHSDVEYYICSHCHEQTFDMLKGFKRILWHSIPNSDGEKVVKEELFPASPMVGGGINTFTRTLSLALFLGYRHYDIFGCDSSFPDDGKTHVDGYETPMDNQKDGFYVYARNETTGMTRRFRTIGPLALQVEEFKEYCACNHQFFSCQVHGDSLLRYAHEQNYPWNYNYE